MTDWEEIYKEQEEYCLKLVARFPVLFTKTDKLNLDFPKGWRLLVEKLCEDILATGYTGFIFQVKEKFGGLRFYPDEYDKSIAPLIDEAQNKSFHICEKCGAYVDNPGADQGCIETLCNECKKK